MNSLQKIYACLKAVKEPVGARELERRLGIPFSTVQQSLQRLRRSGAIRKVQPMDVESTKMAQWEACAKLAKFPERRGSSPESRANLKLGGPNPMRGAAALRNLKHIKLDQFGNYHPKPKLGTLESCWGLTFPTVDANALPCVNNGGEVRPENVEA